MDNATTILGWKSEPQPDRLLRILPECGGRTSNEGGFVHGAPDLVAEVAKAKATAEVAKNTLSGTGTRASEEEIAAFCTAWRERSASYGNPEIAKIREDKLRSALKADGYAIPEQSSEEKLKLLLREHAAKGD